MLLRHCCHQFQGSQPPAAAEQQQRAATAPKVAIAFEAVHRQLKTPAKGAHRHCPLRWNWDRTEWNWLNGRERRKVVTAVVTAAATKMAAKVAATVAATANERHPYVPDEPRIVPPWKKEQRQEEWAEQ